MGDVEIDLRNACAGYLTAAGRLGACPLYERREMRCIAAGARVEQPFDRRPLWCPLDRGPVTLRVREARRDG